MLIVFDVDGTLIGGEAFDWKCFNDAFESVSGKAMTDAFWQSIDEVTAKAVVHYALSEYPEDQREELESKISQTFLENLRADHASHQNAFQAAPETIDLIDTLQSSDRYDIAIATGDWLPSISYKLSKSGIDLSAIPHATSSERYARAEIIRLATERANGNLENTIYVGDGVWDLRACRQLGIPFIGTGERTERLRQAGAEWILPKLDTEPFLEILDDIQTQ